MAAAGDAEICMRRSVPSFFRGSTLVFSSNSFQSHYICACYRFVLIIFFLNCDTLIAFRDFRSGFCAVLEDSNLIAIVPPPRKKLDSQKFLIVATRVRFF